MFGTYLIAIFHRWDTTTPKPDSFHHGVYDAVDWMIDDPEEMDTEVLTALEGEDAAFFHAFDLPHIETTPLTIPELASNYTGNNDLMSFIQYLTAYYTEQKRKKITKLTQKQSLSTYWKEQRLGAVTASNIHKAAHYSGDVEDNYVVQLIMGTATFKGNLATQYGQQHEAVARKLYTIQMKKKHISLKVKPTGIFINKDNPILRSSPDGIVTCKCCGTGVAEIKCPYKNSVRSKTAKEIAVDGKYHIYVGHDKMLHLKQNSPWYTQIQAHLLVTGYPWCDFIMLTEKSPCLMIERIYFDRDFEEIKKKALVFYEKFILPKLFHKN